MPDPELDAAVWDLNSLIDGEGAAGARRVLAEAAARASAFADAYAGRVANLDSDALVAAATELVAITEMSKLGVSYAFLRLASDVRDEEAVVLNAGAEAAKADIAARLVFFELEWIALDDDHAEALLADAGDRLAVASHHLRRIRARRPYLLSPAEERVFAETSVPRLAAWKRLYLEVTGSLMAELDGETVSLTEVEKDLYDPDRTRRRAAMGSIAASLGDGLSTRVAIYNAVLGEKAISDRLRGYPTWLSERNLLNELSDEAVAAELGAIRSRPEIARRWNRVKARLLGVPRLATCDLQAPIPSDEPPLTYGRSHELIVSAFSALSAEGGSIVDDFFTDGRIDAPIRPGKMGGAFCDPVAPNRHPYVLTNFGSRTYSAFHLAHELGHGLHFELSRAQGALQQESSLPIAEVASTFGEALLLDRMLAETGDDSRRLALLAQSLDDATLNVFGGAGFNAFEDRVHTQIREKGDLTADEYTDAWVDAIAALWDDTVEIEPGYRLLWSRIPHMILEPGYMYAYSFALLLSWSAFALYKRSGDDFAQAYLAMLAGGGSRTPEDQAAMIGIDLRDPDFWSSGLDLLDARVQEAEQLASMVG